jgi:hypothetical protein
MAKSLDTLCGTVADVVPLRSGGILVTCIRQAQVKTLLAASSMNLANNNSINIKTSIALANQTVMGKIYAPELQDETLDSLLEFLQPSGVVAIRKLFGDPSKQHVPLYVITFLSRARPPFLKIGYSKYKVDPFVPSPIRCYKCCRWGHSSYSCRSASVCSQCGSKGHMRDNCSAEVAVCPNCKGAHGAFAKVCPVFRQEMDICHVKANQNISFQEARQIVNNSLHINSSSVSVTSPAANNKAHPSASACIPNSLSQAEFPSLPSPRHRPSTVDIEAIPMSEQSLDEPESAWITPGQRSVRRKHPFRNTQSPQNPLSPNSSSNQSQLNPELLSLPPISPISASTQRSLNHNSSLHNTSSCQTNMSSLLPSIKQVIITFLPIIIKLLLSSSLSTKVECFHELGSILQIDSTINSLLSEFGYSSMTNSQN